MDHLKGTNGLKQANSLHGEIDVVLLEGVPLGAVLREGYPRSAETSQHVLPLHPPPSGWTQGPVIAQVLNKRLPLGVAPRGDSPNPCGSGRACDVSRPAPLIEVVDCFP